MSIEEEVLAALSGGGHVSGEAISERLGLSRAAVWKHVENLRRQGYAIEAAPRRGYRLTARPDRLLPAELAPLITGVIGHSVIHCEETTSTADVARRLAGEGAAEGTVVTAEYQSAGRGRLGRAWQTAAGEGLALSVILCPRLPPGRIPLISLATGLAAAEAVAAVTGAATGLKWPNDIYLDGRKLGGVLVEMAAEMDGVRWAVASLGLNVNESFDGTPLAGRAVSLAMHTGRRWPRPLLAAAFLNRLDELYARLLAGDSAAVIDGFERLDILKGRRVTVISGEERVDGEAAGIDESGCLLVEGAGGQRHTLLSGEATLEGI